MDSYQKRRRSRRYRTSSGSPTLVIVLFLAVIAAAIVSFSPLGTRLKDSVVLPLYAKLFQTEQTPAPASEAMAVASSEPVPTPTEPPRVAEVLTITERPFYILQMGQYDSESDALLVSNELQSMGGGGYVYVSEGKYRLFAAAYTDAASLQTVQKQIRRDGFMNEAFITDATVVHVSLEGVDEAVAVYKEGVAVLESVPVSMSELALQFDKGEKSATEVKAELESLRRTVADVIEKLNQIDTGDSHSLGDALREYENALSTFLIGYDNIAMDFYAGALKHLQLETIHAYMTFFEGTDENG